MKEVTKFEAADGAVFDTKEEADARDLEVMHDDAARAWVETKDWPLSTKTRAVKAVKDFLAWRDSV